jgi:LmbE family N-acetylglucosaminyl deacetylase
MFLNAQNLRVLVIGAHPDDIELGCGGLIYRLISECGAVVKFLVVTPGLRHWQHGREFSRQARVQETIEAAGAVGVPKHAVDVLDFKDCSLHLHLHDIIEQLEFHISDHRDGPAYDVILTHARADTHADHATVHDATISAARWYYGTVLLYQSVSTQPNGFHPNYFVSLGDEAIATKQRALNCHVSQREKKFMEWARKQGMAKIWALFLRRPDEIFEAFEVYRAYWWHSEDAALPRNAKIEQSSVRSPGSA